MSNKLLFNFPFCSKEFTSCVFFFEKITTGLTLTKDAPWMPSKCTVISLLVKPASRPNL